MDREKFCGFFMCKNFSVVLTFWRMRVIKPHQNIDIRSHMLP